MKYPNILLIISDQHNARCMSCEGEPLLRTPHMDRIANEGVHFQSAYANSAHCGPSRMSILTGMYEHFHRRHNNEDEPPEWFHSITMNSELKKAGYESALIGKGHLGALWARKEFDVFRSCFLRDSTDDPLDCDYFRYLVQEGVADLYAEDLSLKATNHPEGAYTSPMPLKHSVEEWTGNESVKYLRNRDKNKPFFAMVSFERPHNPLSVPEPYDKMYDPAEIQLPESIKDTFESKPEIQKRASEKVGGYPYRPRDEEHLKKCLGHYYALVSLIDAQIGKIIKELEEQGILDDTIVIYTADHGDFAGEHGFMWKNLGFYEAIHKIPLLIRYPQILPAGKKFNGFVESVDLLPTLAEIAGFPSPPSVQGVSVLPALLGKKEWKKEATLCHHVKSFYHVSMRTREFRITFDVTGEESELYDLRNDKLELENLWSHPDYQKIKCQLLQDLIRYSACPRLLSGPPPEDWLPSDDPGYVQPIFCDEIRELYYKAVPWSSIKGEDT